MISKEPYLELLKSVLIDQRSIGKHEYHPLAIVEPNWRTWPLFLLDKVLDKFNFAICKRKYVEASRRLNGYDHPANALTMIGRGRLENLDFLVGDIIRNNIPGDLLEAGVWRGGACIYMRALLAHHGVDDRKVWVADSFEGLPAPDPDRFPADRNSRFHRRKILRVGQEEVRRNFKDLQLLDDQVVFLPGWFHETLPKAPIKQLAILRIDCDMYGSTMQVLEALYPKLSAGGYVIVDDLNAIPNCRKAIEDHRRKHKITAPLIEIDREAVYWKKEGSA